MRSAHDTGEGGARKRARRVGRRRGLVAAALVVAVQACTLGWALPSFCDPSPDAPWPLRSLLSVERWPAGELPRDKYPEGWYLVAGSFQHVAARLFLSADERAAIVRLRDELVAAQREHLGDPAFDPTRLALERSAGLEPALGRLVLAGRIATLLTSLLLGLAASEIACHVAGPRFGWIAAAAIGLMPATVHYAATLNTDVPALAWCALAWALAVNGARVPAAAASRRAWALFLGSGAAMGLCAATKDPLVGALPGVALLALARREGTLPRLPRIVALALGSAATFALTSGVLRWSTAWAQHVELVLGDASKTYRVFPATLRGALALLKETGDRALVAGGFVGAAGILLLLVTCALRRRWRPLALLAPAATYVALFLLPIGYVYPRFTLPILLCGAIALAWSLAHLAGAPGRRRRVWLGGIVALWGLGEASGVIDAKWSDPRPRAGEELARRRAPGDEVWICAEPLFYVAAPPIAPPRRILSLREAAAAIKRGEARPRFLWLAVGPREPFGEPDGLGQAAERLGMELVGRFASESTAPLVSDPDGLLLPVVGLFETPR
jgi:hypothetical protein